MAPPTRFFRLLLGIGSIAGASALGWFLGGAALAVVAFFAVSCVVVGVSFLLRPRCDNCGSVQLDRLGHSPLRCRVCGHVQSARRVDPTVEEPRPKPPANPSRQQELGYPMLQAFSLLVFLVGVGFAVYSVASFSPPPLSDPSAWQTIWDGQATYGIVGLALTTIGLLLYIESLNL